MSRKTSVIVLALLALAAVGVLGVVYVTGHQFPDAKQTQVKRLAVAVLALLGFLFAVVFARGFIKGGALSAALIVAALLGLGGGAGFVWVKLAPPGPRGASVTPAIIPASRSRMVIRSQPPGASVLLDGTRFATTPASLILPNGKYSVTVRLDGYADWTETVSLTEERELDVQLDDE